MTTHGLESCAVQCGNIERDDPNLHSGLNTSQMILDYQRDQMDLGMIARETKPVRSLPKRTPGDPPPGDCTECLWHPKREEDLILLSEPDITRLLSSTDVDVSNV
jgi:hypothetical protein